MILSSAIILPVLQFQIYQVMTSQIRCTHNIWYKLMIIPVLILYS